MATRESFQATASPMIHVPIRVAIVVTTLEGFLGSNSSDSTDHIRSECNTGKPADFLRVLTQAYSYGSSL